eukprot:jgi/Tetstr1/448525/TSEL_035790.t1
MWLCYRRLLRSPRRRPLRPRLRPLRFSIEYYGRAVEELRNGLLILERTEAADYNAVWRTVGRTLGPGSFSSLETSGIRVRGPLAAITFDTGGVGGPACDCMTGFACVSSTTPIWGNDPRWCTPGIAATEAEQGPPPVPTHRGEDSRVECPRSDIQGGGRNLVSRRASLQPAHRLFLSAKGPHVQDGCLSQLGAVLSAG